GTHAHAVHQTAVTVAQADAAAGGEIPDADALVPTAGDHLGAVRADGDGGDEVQVAGEDPDLLQRVGVPQAHGLVVAAGHRPLPVAAEHDVLRRRGVTGED